MFRFNYVDLLHSRGRTLVALNKHTQEPEYVVQIVYFSEDSSSFSLDFLKELEDNVSEEINFNQE